MTSSRSLDPAPADRRSLSRVAVIATLAVAAAAVLAACQPALPDAKAADSAPPAAPVVPVAPARSATLQSGPIQVARVEAAQHVELRARVSGPIESILFREGDLVRAGQPLFQIDPRPYDAAQARARAELQLAKAREALAATEADRARQLHGDRAIAAEEFERRIAAQAEAQARREAAEAALQLAQLDREFTLVRSPIDGRAGRALITRGNLVAAGAAAPVLTTVAGVAPLHVHFDVADPELLKQQAQERGPKGWRVRILDARGDRELAQAPVDFSDHSIDPATGTLRVRARLDAPVAGLMPGQFVRVQIAGGATPSVLLVPDQAIGTDQGRRYVLVVDASGKVEYRPIAVGAAVGPDRIVTEGLKAGEQVIVSGLLRVRPGMSVRPQPADAAAAHAPQGAAGERS